MDPKSQIEVLNHDGTSDGTAVDLSLAAIMVDRGDFRWYRHKRAIRRLRPDLKPTPPDDEKRRPNSPSALTVQDAEALAGVRPMTAYRRYRLKEWGIVPRPRSVC
jgi:hypothetical protein